jgi:hypothetical protein
MKRSKQRSVIQELPALLASLTLLLFPFFIYAQTSLVNPLQFGTIQDFLKGLLGAVMYIGLPIIALIIVYSGFLFITARGNSEKIKAAIYNFQWVVIGTGVFLGAWALTGIIAGTINMLRDNI